MRIETKHLGLRAYGATLDAMKCFTDQRDGGTMDEIWLLEHPPVYTLGLSGKTEHLINPRDIPVVKSDRGGQVTYHGPGQLMAYVLLDLRRLDIPLRRLVHLLEQAIIDGLRDLGLEGRRRPGAPGVYIGAGKIAALGLRVRRGCTYHGLALNVRMDLRPFEGINPCGYPGLRVVQLADFGLNLDCLEAAAVLQPHLLSQLGYGSGVQGSNPGVRGVSSDRGTAQRHGDPYAG